MVSRLPGWKFWINLKVLSELPIPVLGEEEQLRTVKYLDDLQAKADAVTKIQEETSKEVDALTPSILSKAFCCEL